MVVNRVSLYISQFFQFGHCLSHRGDFLSFVHKNRCMLAIYIYFVYHFFAGIVFSFSYLFHQIFAAFFLVRCVCVCCCFFCRVVFFILSFSLVQWSFWILYVYALHEIPNKNSRATQIKYIFFWGFRKFIIAATALQQHTTDAGKKCDIFFFI